MSYMMRRTRRPPYRLHNTPTTTKQLFDHCGDMRLVMVRFARLSTTAAGLGLVAPGHPGHDVRASCLVVRVEAVPSSQCVAL